MVSFGTPRPADDDATRAVRCARELLRSVTAWNDVRIGQGDEPVRIAIGVHYGPVIAGNLGGEQRLEYTIVGDTVNVASRLEQLTRKLNVSLLASDELVEAAKAESGIEESDLAWLRGGGTTRGARLPRRAPGSGRLPAGKTRRLTS